MRRFLPALLSVATLSACVPPMAGTGDDANIESELSDPNAPVYPTDAPHSPLTDEVVANIRATLARGNRDTTRFMKIGDSMTVSDSFAKCFAHDPVTGAANVRPGDDNASLEETRQHFASSRIGSTTSFDRVSLSATVGWMAVKSIQGNPTPLQREISASNAAFAVVMYGANDTYQGSTGEFTTAMTKIVDRLLAAGVVPLLSTIPPRGTAAPNALVPTMNRVIRTVAEQKRVPLMDLWLEMKDLPGYGLGPDHLHPSAGGDGCQFTSSGMNHGYNWRNLLLIEELDRMRTQILEGSPPPATTGGGNGGGTTGGGTTQPTQPTTGSCFSYTLQAEVSGGECVQSITDDLWYQCVPNQGWVRETTDGAGPLGACTSEHAL